MTWSSVKKWEKNGNNSDIGIHIYDFIFLQ